MTVYVDGLLRHGGSATFHHKMSCHLMADSEQELIDFAVSIGLKPEWIQRGTLTHFDLTPNKRIDAVRSGAIELSPRELVARIRADRVSKSGAKLLYVQS